MAPKNILSKRTESLIKSELLMTLINRLAKLKKADKLPKDIDYIGVAQNILLGVFVLRKSETGYNCFRICEHKNKIVISGFGYPVSNMSEVKGNIECNMDFIISPNILEKL